MLVVKALGGAAVGSMRHLIQLIFMINIGQIIQEELRRQERTPTWLARKINCQRSNVYYIFSQQSINTDLLRRISIALGRDFFNEYSQEIKDTPDVSE